MQPGQKVVCIDDQGWLIGTLDSYPKKGEVCVIRDLEHFGGVLAYSLIGFYPDNYYRAFRFRPLPPASVEANTTNHCNKPPQPRATETRGNTTGGRGYFR